MFAIENTCLHWHAADIWARYQVQTAAKYANAA